MRISDWSSDVCSSDLIADDGAVELAGIDSILRAGAVEQVVLDFRFGDRTKDIKQRFSRRAPSDRPVETIFIDVAEVAEQRRILNRIISGGEPDVVHCVPSGQPRLDNASRPAEAAGEAGG